MKVDCHVYSLEVLKQMGIDAVEAWYSAFSSQEISCLKQEEEECFTQKEVIFTDHKEEACWEWKSLMSRVYINSKRRCMDENFSCGG